MKALFQSICVLCMFCGCGRDCLKGLRKGQRQGEGGCSRVKFFYEYSIHIGIYSKCNVNVCTCVYSCTTVFVFSFVWGEGRGGACCCAVYGVRGLLTTTSFLQWPARKPFPLGRNFLFFFRDFQVGSGMSHQVEGDECSQGPQKS